MFLYFRFLSYTAQTSRARRAGKRNKKQCSQIRTRHCCSDRPIISETQHLFCTTAILKVISHKKHHQHSNTHERDDLQNILTAQRRYITNQAQHNGTTHMNSLRAKWCNTQNNDQITSFLIDSMHTENEKFTQREDSQETRGFSGSKNPQSKLMHTTVRNSSCRITCVE